MATVKTTPNLKGAFSRLKEGCEDRETFERAERIQRRYDEVSHEYEATLYRLEGALTDGNLPFLKEIAEKILLDAGRSDCPNFSEAEMRRQAERAVAEAKNMRKEACPTCKGEARVTERSGQQRTCGYCDGLGFLICR